MVTLLSSYFATTATSDVMKQILHKSLFLVLGWSFVILGVIGVMLPILPTVPFMILALGCFAKSSPKYHQMLLDSRWFGAELQQWEQNKTVSRRTKRRATGLIVATFSISIALLFGRFGLQIMLLGIATILLFFIWQLNE